MNKQELLEFVEEDKLLVRLGGTVSIFLNISHDFRMKYSGSYLKTYTLSIIHIKDNPSLYF